MSNENHNEFLGLQWSFFSNNEISHFKNKDKNRSVHISYRQLVCLLKVFTMLGFKQRETDPLSWALGFEAGQNLSTSSLDCEIEEGLALPEPIFAIDPQGLGQLEREK